MQKQRSMLAWTCAGTVCLAALVHCSLPLTGRLAEGEPDPTRGQGVDGSSDAARDSASDVDLPGMMDAGIVAQDAAIVDSGTDACSADLHSDPKNCGACGHDCLGGACATSQCQPFPIGLADVPKAIAVDATHVYWTNWGAAPGTGTVARALKDGTGLTLLATTQANPLGIAVDTTGVYWTNWTGGAVHGCPVAGCANPAAPPVLAGTATSNPWGIAVDGTSVFWNANNDGDVSKMNLDGGNLSPIASGLNRPVDVKVNATHAFFTVAGEVLRVDRGGSGPIDVIGSGQRGPEALALDATGVYWTQNGTAPGYTDGIVMRANLDGSQPRTFASAQIRPRGIVVDATYVYWTSYGTYASPTLDGTVQRCPLVGACTPTVLARAQGNPIGIAGDGVALYWVNERGRVMKLAK